MLENGEFNISINGCNHWVKVEGAEFNSVPLLLIHGGPGGNHYVFERTTGKKLSGNRTIIYFEQRHCGRSGKVTDLSTLNRDQLMDDMFHLIRHFNLEIVDLLGYSFGAELALNFAVEHPEHVRKIVIESPSLVNLHFSQLNQVAGFLSVVDERKRELIESYVKQYRLDKVIEMTWQLVDAWDVDNLLFNDNEFAYMNRKLWDESKLSNDGIFSKHIVPTMQSEQLLDRLGELDHPVLSIVGVSDRNTGISVNHLLTRYLSQTQTEYFHNSAHFPDIEEGEKFVNCINNFLNKMIHEERYICPVCGYAGLDEPPYGLNGNESFDICTCCGFEFGYSEHFEIEHKFDVLPKDKLAWAFEEYRKDWIKNGAKVFMPEDYPREYMEGNQIKSDRLAEQLENLRNIEMREEE